VGHDLVGIGDGGEVLSRCTGLLAGLLSRTTTTGLGCRLRVAVRGRGLGGVLRVHPEPRPQLRVLCCQGEIGYHQLIQPRGELGELGPQMLVLRRQLDVGRLARRSRR